MVDWALKIDCVSITGWYKYLISKGTGMWERRTNGEWVSEWQREGGEREVYPLPPPFLFKSSGPHAPIHKYWAVLQFGKVKKNLPKCILNDVFLAACFSGWCLDTVVGDADTDRSKGKAEISKWHKETLTAYPVGFDPINVHHKTHAAGITFVGWVVQTSLVAMAATWWRWHHRHGHHWTSPPVTQKQLDLWAV